jgi:hypothetical protein
MPPVDGDTTIADFELACRRPHAAVLQIIRAMRYAWTWPVRRALPGIVPAA